jgi:dihydrofolate reductase
MFEHARSMDALLLGRKTYEIFANYWPRAPEESPFTSLLNGVPKYVASRTLAGPLAWQGSTLVAGDLAENITALKERHDEVHVIGSLNLVQSLLRFGLVDRLNLWLYPLLLGSGKQVFADGTVPTALRLTESVTYPNGTLHSPMRPPARPHTATSPTKNRTYNASPEMTSERARRGSPAPRDPNRSRNTAPELMPISRTLRIRGTAPEREHR